MLIAAWHDIGYEISLLDQCEDMYVRGKQLGSQATSAQIVRAVSSYNKQ